MNPTSASYHVPVMPAETVGHLVTAADGVYVDGTLGGGGHAELICRRLAAGGTLIGIDADADAQAAAAQRLQPFASSIRLVHDNTSNIRAILRSLQIPTIHGLLLDLGVSSYQLDTPGKGFSFRGDEPLDMRMDRRQPLDARTVINTYGEEELANVIFRYGEERASRRIARAVVRRRTERPVDTTGDLARLVEESVGGRFAVKSLARVFQAVRIEVNGELERLRSILRDSMEVLASGGHIVVISYHSLEDRIVKTFFQECAAESVPSGSKYLPDTPRTPDLRILTRKPVEASEDERSANPRSRSAKLRAAERV